MYLMKASNQANTQKKASALFLSLLKQRLAAPRAAGMQAQKVAVTCSKPDLY